MHGRVQGVGFRATLASRARTRGVAGWVRNRADGTVEAVLEGGREAVLALVDWCAAGPRGARVDRVEAEDEQVEGLTGFAVR